MMTIHLNDEVLLDGRHVGWVKPREGGRGFRWRYGTDFIRAGDTERTRIPLKSDANNGHSREMRAALELEIRTLVGL